MCWAAEQLTSLNDAPLGSRVMIAAYSGRFYFETLQIQALEHLSRPDAKACSIDMVLVDPLSGQGILRAVADAAREGPISDALREWTWDKQRQADLYRHVKGISGGRSSD